MAPFRKDDVVRLRGDPTGQLMVVGRCEGARPRVWWAVLKGEESQAWYDSEDLELDPSNARTGNN